MKIVAERLNTLRENAHLSQAKLADMIGTYQPTIARYENGQTTPTLSALVWYADHFDVSLDYIFGRTDDPHGKLYQYQPKIKVESAEMRQFIEMCFDPNSQVSSKLKETIMDIFLKESEDEKT